MQIVRLVIREEIFIQGLPDITKQALMAENQFPNPKKIREMQMMKLCKDERKRNSMRYRFAHTPDDIVLHRSSGDWLALPRGYLGEALKIMDHHGLQVEIDDRTVCPEWSDPPQPGKELFEYQWGALCELLGASTGVMEAPTGSGKTNILLTLIPQISTPTLVVVHTKELLKQTVMRCNSWLGYDPGVIGGGKAKPKDITIAMVQSLDRKDLKAEGLLDRFGCIILDEAHHSPADTWARIIRKFPARYKYGFTATAWRKDKMENLIWRVIGPITSSVSKTEVTAAGRLMLPEVFPVYTEYWFDIADTSDWVKMISDMVENEQRNWTIQETVMLELNRRPDSKALILSDRIEHTEKLAKLLAGYNPVLLNGSLKTVERRENMEKVRAGTRLTIATTHLMGEGVDVPGWDLLFLVTPVVGGPRTVQIMGRVARPAPGKDKALLFDFVDKRVQILQAAFYARNKLYKKRA
jgi:superfamily II DNA or RNA helicase